LVRFFAFLGAVSVAGVATVSAGSNSAQLTVGVTVVRSCAVNARPADAASSFVRLNCAAGAAQGVRLSDTTQRPLNTSGASELRVPTTPSSQSPSGSLQVVTLNF